MRHIGLYLHFPFCAKKCRYCDFPSYEGMAGRMADYIESLCKEISSYKKVSQEYLVDTVYMGGGTPTLFDIKSLDKVFTTCNKVFNISSNAEVTIECNPGTADFEKLKGLKNAGINRLSIGLQAWQNRLLNKLGRIHNQYDFINTVDMAQKACFDNINTDLIFGLPGQTFNDWIDTLEHVAGFDLEHISAYGLKIEEGTEFHNLYEAGMLELPEDDIERQMYHSGIELLKSFGFIQYEISNFAKKGKECRHNINYWRNGEYIGCGSSSHSHINSIRYSNYCNIDEYIYSVMKGNPPVAFMERIDAETEIFETIMLGLRLMEGICENDFCMRFGFKLSERFNKELSELVEKDMLIIDDGYIKPTKKGMDYQNQIALAFL